MADKIRERAERVAAFVASEPYTLHTSYIEAAICEAVAEERRAVQKEIDTLRGGESGVLISADWLRAWLAAREQEAAPKPICRCTGDGHKPDCEFWRSLEVP